MKFEDHTLIEGSFTTPFVKYIPEIIPEEIRKAK